MFMSTSNVMKQAFQKILLPQNAARNFCCVLSSGFTIPESKQFRNKVKINQYQNIFQKQLLLPYTYGIFRTKTSQSSATPNPNETGTTKNKKKDLPQEDLIIDIPQNIGLLARFKLMYKKYWYVLIPVHVTTSIGWVGGFYYLSKSGVDIIALLQSLHVSDVLVSKFQDSNMGHYAIAYLCYKIITPIRYAVTLGGSTVSIKYLVKRGYIKPVPTKQEFIKMYEEKKATLKMKRK